MTGGRWFEQELRRRGLKVTSGEPSELLTNETAFNIVRLLKACTAQKNLIKGAELHAYILEHKALETNSFVASTLVNMYAKCGALAKAQQVLKELPLRDVVAWSALIAGYVQQGEGVKALECYYSMQKEGHSPNVITLTFVLKACGSIGAAAKGKQIHDKIVSLGMLEKNIVLGSALVDMYARCGALAKAEQVLEELSVRDVVTWSALIAGCVQHGQGEKALKCFDNMRHEGHFPDGAAFTFALKACGSTGAVTKGEEIHNEILRLELLEKNVMLGSTLVDMYAKCGALAKAQQVLQELPIRNEITWSALMAGYVQHGQGEEALKCYDNMQLDGHSPNEVTFACALKACGSIGAAVKGEQIHEKIASLDILKQNIILGNALVDMYAKCGAFAKAQKLLEELPVRDAATWNALITGYAQQGRGEEALNCYDSMQLEGHTPDVVTFICALKACGRIGAAAKGEQIHEKIVSLGLLEKDIVLGNTLVDMYVKCGSLSKAQQVLEELPIRNVVTWNAVIAGYVELGQAQEALKYYDTMQHEGHSVDAVTLICALKACGSIGAAAKGQQIHEKIVSLGLLEKNVVLWNSLVDMYAKCGALAQAQQLLEELPTRDVVTWNALIAGYALHGQGEEALKCYNSMEREGHSPNAVTFICALKACGSIGAATKAKQIHKKVVSSGLLEKDVILGSTLVDVYAKCGALGEAHQVLKALPIRNWVTWNALLTGYVEQGEMEEALNCYDNMRCEGHSPDVVSFICALKACGTTAVAAKGEQIHREIVSLGMLENDVVLGNTLVDMYAKCGEVKIAQQVVEELPVHDVVTWSALIAGYAQQGQSLDALDCFEKMQFNKVKPNSATLSSVLNACSHSGLMDHAEMLFSAAGTMYDITLDEEHYCCMVDLFARAGNFKVALSVIEKMPFVRHLLVWVVLLGACRKGEEVNIGRLAFDHALHSNKSEASIYICMAVIYTAAGMPDDSNMIEVMRVANKAWTMPSYC